ncbi:acyltransferase [Leptospira sp. 2 VSF19]|uniref:Acyltransferase n=1 Tax=Leptospira soteropolitanensis TaxID=2950025 RepID=A0AAW5VGX7_9LEPT|nr:acyltransferase [Leptospira soteropolitanensis]MCW7491232.1 acyltransferase [Leptospira soteropolitanensis]MCW7498817.1 acyltransferase [Leptospira soteropolitanensis]MCW7521591.1 acyltransferase [Leptospira soteropolitanensis]MCW7524920.1 acyltransferase [Leptospira soteropolitanensis]MCW7528788.1 acyltransferase [Leptospira soteropolitanensis]
MLKYRAEIDGLRAIAVLSVIFFHAGFSLFKGGFVGVDVFFVISGYLITSIILNEVENNSFSIFNFYERRIRRILPSLFFIMLTCIPFAWLILEPKDLDSFFKSLKAIPTFTSNVFFWKDVDYFETASELKPLIHTWSLAVEEQYYVVFPILFLIIRKVRKRTNERTKYNSYSACLSFGIKFFLCTGFICKKPIKKLLPTAITILGDFSGRIYRLSPSLCF